MKWFRLWTDILDDPKLNCLSAEDERRFIRLLAICAEQENDGKLSGTIRAFSWRMRTSEGALNKTIQKLIELNILKQNGNGLEFIHWKKRQFRSDNPTERWRAWKANVGSNVVQTLAPTATETDTDTETENTPIVPKIVDDAFNEFWNAYPKKIGKTAALKSWIKIKNPKTVLPRILTALSWQTSSDQWTKENGKYIPNPTTYLNQGRWEDEPYGKQTSSEDDDNLFLRGIREERERQARKRMGGSSTQIPGSAGDLGGTKSP